MTAWRGLREEASIGMAPIYECGRQTGAYLPNRGVNHWECVECREWMESLLRRAMAQGVRMVNGHTSAWVGEGLSPAQLVEAIEAGQVDFESEVGSRPAVE